MNVLAVMFPSYVQRQATLSESVILSKEISPLECPPISETAQQTEFGQGGKPQAVLPQGGQGKLYNC